MVEVPKSAPRNSGKPSSQPAPLAPRLPPELLDAIAAHIDARRDLSAFARACRLFHSTAVPRHTAHRAVRAAYSDGAAWARLLARPDLAARARVAHVRDAPRRGAYPDKAGQLRVVASALRGMHRLRAFAWAPPLSLRGDGERAAVADVWAAVARAEGLKHLAIVQPINPPGQFPAYGDGGVERYPLWSLGGLTSIALANVSFLRHHESVAQFARVLERCPRLERLHVVLYDWNFALGTMLGAARFPLLRALTLELYADPECNSEALARLLEQTPSVETLEWDHIPLQRPLAPGALPNLRHLANATELAQLSDAPRALHALGRAELRAAEPPLHLNTCALVRLEVCFFDDIEELARTLYTLPSLRWLRLPSVDYACDWRGVTREAVYLGEWGRIVEAAPALEVFHGPCLFRDPGLGCEGACDERAAELAVAAPGLRRVEHWSLALNRAILLERGGWREVEVLDGDDWVVDGTTELDAGARAAGEFDGLFRWRTGL